MALENKLGIEGDIELAREVERLTKLRALELFESGLLDAFEVGTFAGLAQIHRHLFQDVYEFAGKCRKVNIAKGSFRFVPVMYLSAALGAIDRMPQSTFDEIVEKYVEMNVAHPFREGNGRSARIWLDCIFKKGLGAVVDWSRVDKEDYLLAMERSPVRNTEIKTLLKAVLTDRVDDRQVYMKGIDASWRYEGYSAYAMMNCMDRRWLMEEAIHSSEVEGAYVSAEFREDAEEYVEGDISIEELMTRTKRRWRVGCRDDEGSAERL